MRIGVNCFLLLPEAGGVRQYFLALFNQLLADDSREEYVFFHTEQNLPLLCELENSRWRATAVKIHRQREIRRHLHGLDLYFCPFGSLWPRPLARPSVVTLVDVQEQFYPGFFTPMELYLRELHYVGSTRLANRVVTISDFSKHTIVERHGIAPEKVLVAHLCADPRFLEADRHGVRPNSLLPERFALFPANHWPHKNHEALFRALSWLRREHEMTIPLMVTGHTNVSASGSPLEERIAAHGLADQVHLLGYVRTEELIYLFSHAEMLVFPSLFEGFGIPLVEAMTVGCPVACSNTASLPEVGGEAVLYFDPDDEVSMAKTMMQLWTDQALREALAGSGRKRVGMFSPRSMADVHRQAFAAARNAFLPTAYLGDWICHVGHVLRTKWNHRQHALGAAK